MQLKNFYPKMSFLGIATVMALTACGDENADTLFASNPIPNADYPYPVSSSGMYPTSSEAVVDPTSSSSITILPAESSSSATAIDPSTLPAEGPITLPTGTGILLDDFEDGDGVTKTDDGWYTYDDKDNGGASVIVTPINEEKYPIAERVNNGSNYAFKVVYSLDRGEYAYDPYVGWGVQIAQNDANGRLGGITYWY